MDKMIYLLAGLAFGHIFSRREAEVILENKLENKQGVPPAEEECTFRCWLCDGTTTFTYVHESGPINYQVECLRCGMENIVKFD